MTNRQKPAPTLQELVDYVSEKLGTSVSVSSIQKDIYAMRFDASLGFNAPIAYDPVKRGYVYTEPGYSINRIPVSEEDLQGLEMAIGLLEQFKDIPAIRLFEDAITKLAATVKQSRDMGNENRFLLLDRPKRYKGIEYMEEIVTAIRNKQALRIYYLPFSKTEEQKHLVHPYFIKEYNGRMYLIGKDIHPTKEAKFLTFSFDRMQKVVMLSQTFREEMLDMENYFRSAIGISMNQSPPERIQLSFDPAQAQYIKTQPLHHSQKILKDKPKEFVIEMELVINYELMALILSFGDKVKVLKPATLAQSIRKTAAAMLNHYEGA